MRRIKTAVRFWQSGIGLPAAIFVIILMVIISIAVNRLVGQNARTFEEQINLARSLYAAESGAGLVMNQIYPPEEFPAYGGGACPVSPVTYNFTVDGLNQCAATVSCDSSVVIGGKTHAAIESVGACGNVQRTVRVRTAYDN